MDLAILQFLET